MKGEGERGRDPAAERWYRRLLLILPPSYRAAVAEDLVQVFRDEHEDVSRSGRRGPVLALWALVLLDTAALLPRAWWSVLTRGMGGWDMRQWLGDVRLALRSLARRRGFATGFVLTLGLGIGATTAIYGVVDGVLLSPLPYPEPGRLVAVGEVSRTGAWLDEGADVMDLTSIPRPRAERLGERAHTLESLAAIERSVTLLPDFGDGPEIVPSARVSSNLFDLLGVAPSLGRTLLPEEHRPGAGRVAMITHGAWQRRFGSDPTIIGATFPGASTTIIGVLPPTFAPLQAFFPSDEIPDVYIPLPESIGAQARSDAMVYVIGRLAPGATVELARKETADLAAELSGELRDANVRPDDPVTIGVNGLRAQTVGATARTLSIFLGAAVRLLLLAAMNAAALLLARSLSRTHDLGVRVALGASRGSITRLLLTEAGLLSLLGGLVGAGVAYGAVAAFVRLAPPSVPRLTDVRVDGGVLVAALAVTVGAGLVAGLLPALRLAALRPWEGLRPSGSTTATSGARFHRGLVGTQMALAVVLLSAAGLLFSSFVRIRGFDPGFEPQGLVTMSDNVELLMRTHEMSGALEDIDPWQFWDRVVDGLRAVPGVEAVGAVNALPFQAPAWMPQVLLPGDADDTWREGIAAYVVTPEYLPTLGARVLDGRGIEQLDGPDAERVMVVNETFVRTQLQREDAVGSVVRIVDRGSPVPYRVVGVVEDVVQTRVEEGPRPAIYVPHTQRIWAIVRPVVRTSLPPETIIPELRAAAARVNPTVPPRDQRTMLARMAETRATPRFHALLIGTFSLVALLLAATGLYASLAHAVGRRRRELGVRMAIGADGTSLVGMVLRDGLRLAAIGVLVGVAVTLASNRLLAGLLYEVRPGDPATLLGVGAVLMVVSAAASIAPARRATEVDPVTVLRSD